jgi:glutathione S-transferase
LKLIYNPTSPFARKVLVVLAEKGLDAGVEGMVVNPWDEPEVLTRVNPISQIPTLILDDGSGLFDSGVIAAYLDSLADAPPLIPVGPDAWRVRRTEAAADAICETVVKLRREGQRPAVQRSPSNTERWRRSVVRALDALEAEGSDGGLDLGEIMLTIALEYVDFREPDLRWREGRPNLVARWRRLEARPSFRSTRPT